MRALIVGATGATGKDLVDLLIKDESFTQVDIFVRRSVDVQHARLRVHIIDFDKPDQWKHLIVGDVLFSCLGTTLKVAGSKEAQWKIDYEYQYQFAKTARENGVRNYVLVSSSYASPGSFIFYSKMKGKLEVAVKALGFPSVSIFKPPTLIRKGTERGAEVTTVKVISFLNKLGLLVWQKPMPTEVLAQAMINVSKTASPGVAVYESREIWTLEK